MANSIPNVTQLFGTTLYQNIPQPELTYLAAAVKPVELHNGDNPYAKVRVAIERWDSKSAANVSTYANLTVFGKSAITLEKYVKVGQRFIFYPSGPARIGADPAKLAEGTSFYVDFTANRIQLLPNAKAADEVDPFAGDDAPAAAEEF